MIVRSVRGVCVCVDGVDETLDAPKVEDERADADNEEDNAKLLEEEEEETKEPASPDAKEDVVTGIIDVVDKGVGVAVFETLAERGV